MKTAVLLLAHGAPRDLDDVDRYVTHIRHGRPLPPDQMDVIRDRYRQVGGSPLLEITRRQSAALQSRLNETGHNARVYLGMRHSDPFISEAVEQIVNDGVESIVALCMAPQYSQLTIGAYRRVLEEAIGSKNLPVSMVSSFARHPGLIRAFATKLREARASHPQASVIFTAHSLPERVLQEADPYDYEVKETACLTAAASETQDWKFAYQSQGMTAEKWMGPTVEARIDELAAKGTKEIIVAPIGFVCDHVEILYDIDVAFRDFARARGIELYRAASLNDSPEFIELLFALVSERL